MGRYSTHPMPGPGSRIRIPPPLVALIGWLFPGAGYMVIGQTARGMVVCITIIVLWLSGLLVAGVRVIEVPGYDSQTGAEIRISREGRLVPPQDRDYASAGWAVTNGGFFSELTNKPWYAGQILAGPLCLWTSSKAVELARRGPDFPRPHASLETVGVLYTAIAGMLNLLVMIDAAHRAGQPPTPVTTGKSP